MQDFRGAVGKWVAVKFSCVCFSLPLSYPFSFIPCLLDPLSHHLSSFHLLSSLLLLDFFPSFIPLSYSPFPSSFSHLLPPSSPLNPPWKFSTPLIKLSKLSESTGCTIAVKAENLNPGGSVKDRAALYLIKEAEEKGGWSQCTHGHMILHHSTNHSIKLYWNKSWVCYMVFLNWLARACALNKLHLPK